MFVFCSFGLKNLRLTFKTSSTTLPWIRGKARNAFRWNFTVSVEAPSTVTKLERQHRMDHLGEDVHPCRAPKRCGGFRSSGTASGVRGSSQHLSRLNSEERASRCASRRMSWTVALLVARAQTTPLLFSSAAQSDCRSARRGRRGLRAASGAQSAVRISSRIYGRARQISWCPSCRCRRACRR